MASLVKRDNSPYWFAAFDVTLPDGTVRRLKKSTKKRKRSEAMVEAIRLEELERSAGIAEGESASKAYAILSEAAAAAAKGELSEARARELIARLCEVSTGEPLRFYTVRSWAADWLAVKATTGKKSTIARYSAHIESFLIWLGSKADGKLESVTKSDVRAFRDAIRTGWSETGEKTSGKRIKANNAPAIQRTAKTANHYAADVAGMFRAAMREGLLLANPCAALERLPEDDSTEREVFSMAEVGKLMESAGDPNWQNSVFPSGIADTETRAARCIGWQGMILVGFYAGARIGDCAALTWENVNLSGNSLSFIPAKTSRKKKRLEVPLHPRLLSWLKEQSPSTGSVPLFPALVKSPVGGRHGLSSMFIAIMDHAQIDRRNLREGTKGGQRAQHARSFHALRHSLTSNLANLDVSEEIRRRIVGHESADVHAKYTHTERETLARALEKLPSI
ncbi:tyrosine-type recombinase/integrase [Luteolibacter pohnpeiensis]|uniref:Tyrosine-type recombinase/integrase n=1 Tax=Luteolibacter pohnpeiensis TaxID=454153 RepID=A0A934SBC6_9BACT|nr:tyrosine-type recombinase/integrase [Luteolibacter pohnpeiensis]MBK1884386.1 tyrosine-type recombinase/integrase [Luteolibacter pohnpeiensis]